MPTRIPRSSFELRPSTPYSLARTAERFTRFDERVDRFDGETYERLLLHAGQPLLIRARQSGPPSRPRLSVQLVGRDARKAAARERARIFLERALGTKHALGRFYARFAGDPLIGPAIAEMRGLAIAGHGDCFETLVTTVLSQQVNLKFAHSIRCELVEAFGRRARIEGATYHAFPTPARIARETPAALRAFRLSDAKAQTLARLARAFARGALGDDALAAMDDDAVIERLVAIKGIGRWTADTLLIRGLGRADVFPAGDLGVVKYLARGLLGRETSASEAEMREFSLRWQPYRSYALIYAYAALRRRREEAGRARDGDVTARNRRARAASRDPETPAR
jgi:DNA-3-methyladenine glycosylase II